MDFSQILATFGITGLVIILASLGIYRILLSIATRMSADATRVTSEANQNDTFNKLLISQDEERRLAQERFYTQQQQNNHVYAELSDLKSKYAYEAGRRDEILTGIERERAEWKTKSDAFDDKIRTMETSILDLQKNQRDNQAKIRDLEGQVDTLNQRIADKDGEIVSLKAMIVQLETEKAQLLNLNTELSKQVDERSARVENLSQLVKLGNDADFIPTVISDNTQALPDLSADDTVIPILPHPLPELPETNVNEPPPNADAA